MSSTTILTCVPAAEGQATQSPCPDGQVIQAAVGFFPVEPEPYDPAIGQEIVAATIGPILVMYLIFRGGGELIGLFSK